MRFYELKGCSYLPGEGEIEFAKPPLTKKSIAKLKPCKLGFFVIATDY